MTLSSSSIDENDILDFFGSVGVAVVGIKQIQESITVEVNNPFKSEFDVESEMDEFPIENAVSDSNFPIRRLPETQQTGCVNVDLITYDCVEYLRNRIWSSECVFDIYYRAEKEIPHQKHISVLHRVFRHNLRNEINTILGWANVINEEVPDENRVVSEAAETVIDRVEVIDEISEEAGVLENVLHTDTKLEEKNVSEILHKVISRCEGKFDNSEIRKNITPNLTVLGNDKLHYVFDNIIDNSIRHNDPSTVTTVEASESSDSVVITISDDGKGLPPVEKKIVTNECNITQLSHGSGLGLWIVRRVLDIHRADVDVTTVDKEGTEYEITLHQPDG